MGPGTVLQDLGSCGPGLVCLPPFRLTWLQPLVLLLTGLCGLSLLRLFSGEVELLLIKVQQILLIFLLGKLLLVMLMICYWLRLYRLVQIERFLQSLGVVGVSCEEVLLGWHLLLRLLLLLLVSVLVSMAYSSSGHV